VKAAKVNAGLAESNGKLLPGLWPELLHVTCGLTACTPGSAPGPTLGNEYGKTLPFTSYPRSNKIVRRHILPFVRCSKPLVKMQVFHAVLVFGDFGFDDPINISSRYLAAQSESTA